MNDHDKSVIAEAMKRANPDIDGDLMQKIEEIDPSTAVKMRQLLRKFQYDRNAALSIRARHSLN
jgi:hypothetical protein